MLISQYSEHTFSLSILFYLDLPSDGIGNKHYNKVYYYETDTTIPYNKKNNIMVGWLRRERGEGVGGGRKREREREIDS